MAKKEKDYVTGEEIGQDILQAVTEMKAGKVSRMTKIAANEVSSARMQTGLTQAEFAQALQISKRTLEGWEQGRRQPTGAAQALIRIACRHPEVIRENLKLMG